MTHEVVGRECCGVGCTHRTFDLCDPRDLFERHSVSTLAVKILCFREDEGCPFLAGCPSSTSLHIPNPNPTDIFALGLGLGHLGQVVVVVTRKCADHE